jgi:hypothetical protein
VHASGTACTRLAALAGVLCDGPCVAAWSCGLLALHHGDAAIHTEAAAAL